MRRNNDFIGPLQAYINGAGNSTYIDLGFGASISTYIDLGYGAGIMVILIRATALAFLAILSHGLRHKCTCL